MRTKRRQSPILSSAEQQELNDAVASIAQMNADSPLCKDLLLVRNSKQCVIKGWSTFCDQLMSKFYLSNLITSNIQ